jgi:hypothetical protein
MRKFGYNFPVNISIIILCEVDCIGMQTDVPASLQSTFGLPLSMDIFH